MLETSKLQPGDLILTSEKSSLSMLIRLGLWSRFSHVSMVVSGGLYVEALGLGVRVRSLNTILVNNIKVLRYGDSNSALNASEAIKEYLHSEYWWQGAIKSRFRLNRKDSNTLFCSNLVALAFSDIGLPISQILPSNITPKDIERSKSFTDITNDVVFRPKYIPIFLKESGFQTVSDIETLTMQKICLSIDLWGSKQGLETPYGFLKILKFLYTLDDKLLQQKLDIVIVEAIQEHRLTDLILYARNKVIAPLEQVFLKLDKTSHSKETVSVEYYLMESGHNSLLESQKVLNENLGIYRDLFMQSKLMSFEVMTAYTEALLKQHDYVIRYIVGILNYYYETYPQYFE